MAENLKYLGKCNIFGLSKRFVDFDISDAKANMDIKL